MMVTLRQIFIVAVVGLSILFFGAWWGYDLRDSQISSEEIRALEIQRRTVAAQHALDDEYFRPERNRQMLVQIVSCSIIGIFFVLLGVGLSLVGWARLMRLTDPRVTIEGRVAEHYYKLPPAMDTIQIDERKLKRLPAANVVLMRDLLEKSVERFGADTARIMPSDQFGGYAKWRAAVNAIEAITPIAKTEAGKIPKSGATLTERKVSDLLAMLDNESEDE